MQETRETQVWSLGWEESLEKEMATPSGIFVHGNPMDRGAWQATGHRVTRVRYDLATKAPPPPPKILNPMLSSWTVIIFTLWEAYFFFKVMCFLKTLICFLGAPPIRLTTLEELTLVTTTGWALSFSYWFFSACFLHLLSLETTFLPEGQLWIL